MSKSKHSFDDFWNRIICRAIDLCIKELDPSFQAQAGVNTRKLTEYKAELELMYKQKRNWLKYEYLPEELIPSLDMHKLSSILCRCVIGNKFFSYDTSAVELLQAERKLNKTISHNEQIAWEISNIYINYKLAFLIAEGIAFDDLLYWAQRRINQDTKRLKLSKEQGEDSTGQEKLSTSEVEEIQKRLFYTNSFIQKLSKEGKLRRYVCGPTHDDFVSSIIVSLMKSDCLRRDYDYLSMSAIMFQWQEYTKVRIFTEIIEDSNHTGGAENINALLSLCLK